LPTTGIYIAGQDISIILSLPNNCEGEKDEKEFNSIIIFLKS
jgi:hypothetical protein